MLTNAIRVGLTQGVHDTITVQVVTASAQRGVDWIVPGVTALGAILAGLLAQKFGAAIHADRVRRHVVAGLYVDLEVLQTLLLTMTADRRERGSISMHELAQVDMLLRRFDNVSRDLAYVPGWVRWRVERFYRRLVGVRETHRLIAELNTEAAKGFGEAVPREDVDGLYSAMRDLVTMCCDARAVVWVDHSRAYAVLAWVEHMLFRLGVPARWVVWGDIRRNRKIDDVRKRYAAEAEETATEASEKPGGPEAVDP